MKCPNCGNENANSNIFCDMCGTKISSAAIGGNRASRINILGGSIEQAQQALEDRINARLSTSLRQSEQPQNTIQPDDEVEDTTCIHANFNETFWFSFTKADGSPDNQMAETAKNWIFKKHKSWQEQFDLRLEVDGGTLLTDREEFSDGWPCRGSSYNPLTLPEEICNNLHPQNMVFIANSYHADEDNKEDLYRYVYKNGKVVENVNFSAFFSSEVEGYIASDGEVESDDDDLHVLNSSTYQPQIMHMIYENEAGERIEEDCEITACIEDFTVTKLSIYSMIQDRNFPLTDSSGNYVTNLFESDIAVDFASGDCDDFKLIELTYKS